jgi:hypothetical protein
MSKLLLLTGAILLIFGLPLFADEELELGMSFTPIGLLFGDDASADGPDPADQGDDYYYEESDLLDEWLISFHAGYNWGILYATLDAIVFPPFLMEKITSEDEYNEDTQQWESKPGFDRPGFFNLIDVGIKFSLGDIILYGETGINVLYIYKQNEIPSNERPGTIGTNLRIGANYIIADGLSVGINGTAIFSSFKTMARALEAVFSGEQGGAADQIQFLPMLAVTFHM